MRQLTGPLLVQIIVWYSLAPNHYQDQGGLIVSWILGDKFQGNLIKNKKTLIQINEYEMSSAMSATFRIVFVKGVL